MKKSTLALSALAIVVAGITGGAWFSGTQIEKYAPDFLTAFEQSLVASAKAHDVDVTIKNIQRERGLFSTDFSFEVDAKMPNQEVIPFYGKSKIYHGPIPLNRLITFNLFPVIASAEAEISSPHMRLQKIFNQKPILNSQISVGYSGDMQVKTTVNPIHNEAEKLKTSEIHYQGNLTPFGKQTIRADHILIGEESAPRVQLQGLALESDFIYNEKYPFVNMIGPYKFTANTAQIHLEKGEQFNLSNLNSNGTGKFENEHVIANGNFSFNVEVENKALNVKENLGKVQLNTFGDFDAQMFNTIMPYSADNIQTPEAFNAYLDFLNKSVLEIQELSLENSKGKNDISLRLGFHQLNAQNINNPDKFLTLFKNSVLNTQLNLSATEELVKQFMRFDPTTKDTAEQHAKQAMTQFIAQAKASGLAVVDEKNINMKLEIDNGVVKLNGQVVPEKDVQMAIFMIMMGVGGFGR